jgi:hypothetical protein
MTILHYIVFGLASIKLVAFVIVILRSIREFEKENF